MREERISMYKYDGMTVLDLAARIDMVN
jgi:hypothetical protein